MLIKYLHAIVKIELGPFHALAINFAIAKGELLLKLVNAMEELQLMWIVIVEQELQPTATAIVELRLTAIT